MSNNVITDNSVASMQPNDSKLWIRSKTDLIFLGVDNYKAYTYYDSMRVICAEEKEIWEWRELKTLNEVGGLLPVEFTYPNGVIAKEINYSNKKYNFFKVLQASDVTVATINFNNLPGGIGLYKDVTVVTPGTNQYNFKSIFSESLMITQTPNTVKIETNTYSLKNKGAGKKIYVLPNTAALNNIEFNLKTLMPTNNSINVTEDANSIYFEINPIWLQQAICEMIGACNINVLLKNIEIDWNFSHTKEDLFSELEINNIDIHAHSIVLENTETVVSGSWQKEYGTGWKNVAAYTTPIKTLLIKPGYLNRFRLKITTSTGSILFSNSLNISVSNMTADPDNPNGGGCPTLDMKLNTALNQFKLVSELKIGDFLYTKHESTKEYGLYPISKLELSEQNILRFLLENDIEIKVSESHEFETIEGTYKKSHLYNLEDTLLYNNELKTIKVIENLGLLPVMKIEVENAHTYMVNGVHSHNKVLPDFIESSGKT